MRLASPLLVVCLLGVPLPSEGQVAEPPPPPTLRNPGLDEDPHVDRVWFSPTAITQPAGTFEFNDYELIILGLTYGATDNLQISAAFLPPIVEDMPFLGFVSGKVSFSAGDRVHLALLGGLAYASVDDDSGGAAGLGGAISVCLDSPCASLLSAFIYGAFFFESNDDFVPFGYGVSLVGRLATHVKLALEVASAGAVARADAELAEAFVLSYGVRFFSGNLAGDVGFAKFIAFDEDFDDPFILGAPILTFTYRWGAGQP